MRYRRMIARKEGNLLLVKLDDGEDLMESLAGALSMMHVKHGGYTHRNRHAEGL